ncbi:hypothetical protein OPV22_025110 [Ensete ventricosum]|uniref:Secreted protein n=1 Tax=Ensete ventricosum TaxID=4639 RepID=A0AAV8Q706_ENSVE|nr:hypothetical protein OPV22_025110 [Ensete ventricosum]RWW31880.1 hypothetical protein GW17_00003478 [Ensete ventricosum]
MVSHLVIIGKLTLLAGGHSNCHILASLLCPFALKLPFVVARLVLPFRFFLFRLGRIIAAEAASAAHRRHGRWGRALRLLCGDRPAGNEERLRLLPPSDELLTAISMLTL